MRVITLDFETFWSSRDYTLSKMGPIEYVRDPRFHAQLLGVRVDRGPVNVYESHEIHEALEALDLEAEDIIIAGHNLHGFDALVLSERFGIRPKYRSTRSRWPGQRASAVSSHAAIRRCASIWARG